MPQFMQLQYELAKPLILNYLIIRINYRIYPKLLNAFEWVIKKIDVWIYNQNV